MIGTRLKAIVRLLRCMSNGRVDFTEDAAGCRTAYAYDPATGRRITVTDALTNTVYSAYDLQGRASNVWGATYPVAYEYDAYGRMTAMKTWRDVNATPDATRWDYDEATGLMTNKLYADVVGPVYEYDASGRLSKRIWARGVETDYTYDNLGQLLSIEYSDDTPDVAFAYDRMGRQVTITDVLGTRTNVYDGIFSLLEEQLPNGDVLARSTDSLGRNTGFSLNNDALQVVYAYDAYGRFSSIQWEGDGMISVQSAYSYLQDSRLLSGWAISGNALSNVLQVSRTYEPHRDLLLTVSNRAGNTGISSFRYQNDVIGRRTARVDDGSTSNVFGYNTRSELTSAQMDTNMFAYLYDAIGNRIEASANAVMTYYEANELNQYTEIEHITPINPSYDEDGNLTNDTEWVYTWDAENRLINARRLQPTPQSWNVMYQYDYMGRLNRRDFTYGPPSASSEVNEYIYDGWNRIRSRHWNGRSEATSTVTTNYWVWGLDLAGTLQDAGGVGGLLAEITPDGVRYPFCDGNGNITDWLDNDGAIIAHHEYDPYGNEMTGYEPTSFGFSSKPRDPNLGIYYYGYRFYSPAMGRWVSKDPKGEHAFHLFNHRQRLLRLAQIEGNSYVLCVNSPLSKIDLFGLQAYEPIFDNEPLFDLDAITDAITTLINSSCLLEILEQAMAPSGGDHCVVSCELTKKCGEDIAAFLGLGLEVFQIASYMLFDWLHDNLNSNLFHDLTDEQFLALLQDSLKDLTDDGDGINCATLAKTANAVVPSHLRSEVRIEI